MDSLEEKEQEIIQHIRTAGLQKRREVAIVDELLNIRQERRKIMSALKLRIDELAEENRNAREQGQLIQAKFKNELLEIEGSQKSIIQGLLSSQQKWKEEKELLLKELSQAKENQKALALSQKEKISLLAAKVSELSQLDRRNMDQMRTDIEENVRERVEQEIKSAFEPEIHRLKEHIRTLADREEYAKRVNMDAQQMLMTYRKEIE